jgi:hypothetical protein
MNSHKKNAGDRYQTTAGLNFYDKTYHFTRTIERSPVQQSL